VLATGLLLGWLRWTSGSVWPGVLAHFLNNGLATVLVVGGIDSEWTAPWWLAATALFVSVVACLPAGLALRRTA
jgi:membrane protease YdiL (CAAX protease family)